jgi:hypothetical protein
MNWPQVIQDPILADLPYKIELNEWGNIEMSPADNRHNMLQSKILLKLKELVKDGDVFVRCSILTAKNVKVADVVWGSTAFLRKTDLKRRTTSLRKSAWKSSPPVIPQPK